MYCKNCHKTFEPGVKYCPDCGEYLVDEEQELSTTAGKPDRKLFKFHSTYIFVVSLIFLILLSISTINELSSLNSLSDLITTYSTSAYVYILKDMQTILVVELLLVLGLLGLTITLVVFSSRIKTRNLSEAPKAEMLTLTKVQLILAIAFLVTMVVFAGFEIFAMVKMKEFYGTLGIAYTNNDVLSYFMDAVRIGLIIPMVVFAKSKHETALLAL